MNPVTVQDAVDFVLHHRAGKVFKGLTPEAVGQKIIHALAQNACFWVQNVRGEIVGLCLCEPDHAQKKVHVAHLLTTEPCLVALARLYHRFFAGYHLTARRRGRSVVYNTPRLLQLMEAQRL